MIILKSPSALARMRDAGRIVARVLERLREVVQPGITTTQLEEEACAVIAREGGRPSFKGYRGFPAAIRTSINQEVVHGIPSPHLYYSESTLARPAAEEGHLSNDIVPGKKIPPTQDQSPGRHCPISPLLSLSHIPAPVVRKGGHDLRMHSITSHNDSSITSSYWSPPKG